MDMSTVALNSTSLQVSLLPVLLLKGSNQQLTTLAIVIVISQCLIMFG